MSEGKVIVAPRIRDLDELSRDLGTWLRARMPHAKDLSLGNFDYPHGAGRSHETILFDASWTESGGQHSQGMVVRIKPSDHIYYPDDLFDAQIRIMQLLREQGRVKVARIFWREDDPAVLGNAFFVMEKKRGRVAVTTPPYASTGWVAEATPAQRAKFWESGVRQLGAMQATPLDSIGFLAGKDGLCGFEQEWDKYVRFLEWISAGHRWPALDSALADLRSRWPKNRPEGLVWGDARIGNMMFDDDMNVVCVMDWEQPSLGGALNDLAWFCVLSETMHGRNSLMGRHLEGMGSRAETIARWEAITGKSAADLEWFEDFTHFKMTCTGMRMGHWRGSQMFDEAQIAKRLKVD